MWPGQGCQDHLFGLGRLAVLQAWQILPSPKKKKAWERQSSRATDMCNSQTMQSLICIADKVAVKILDKTKLDAKTQRLLSREISSMERLHHPNVIRLYEVIETLSKLHLVMEYASCGELFTKISNDGRLQESEAKPLFAQIVAAVEHMVVLVQFF